MEAHPKLELVPLREKSIRLLKIHPELKGNNIACTLNQYDNKIPPYNALSYCWGNPESQDPQSQESTTRKVYINNTLISVHETLWDFLDQMQQSGRTEDWIWIDFLCLNQRDHTEMSQQISRMGDIYSQAKTTISWLGRNRSSEPQQPLGLEEAFGIIASEVAVKRATLERFFSQPTLNRWTNMRKMAQNDSHILDALTSTDADRFVLYQNLPEALPEISYSSDVQKPMRLSIDVVISSPYWKRAWVTQEVALAQRVILMFGEATLNFDDFFLAYRSYYYYLITTQWGFLLPLGALQVPIEARAAVRENNITFQQVIQWGRDCKASRNIDRIYGLLGLLQRCGDGDGIGALPPILTGVIEYEREWSEVYLEIALTYRPLKDTLDDEKYRTILAGWADFFCRSAVFFSCEFSSRMLQYAVSERATQLCRNKARTALQAIALFKSAMMTDVDNRLRAVTVAEYLQSHESSWLTNPCARQLWSEAETGRFRSFQNLLAALFLETDEGQFMDENEKYHAVYMALRMLDTDDLEAEDREGTASWKSFSRFKSFINAKRKTDILSFKARDGR